MNRIARQIAGLGLFLIAAALAGRLADALLLVSCVLSHELAHLAMALGLGYRPTGLRLTLFGGMLGLAPDLAGDPGGEAAIALAGPLHHLLLVWLGLHAPGFRETLGPHWPFFVRTNLTLGLFNLLPVLPLDGGRLLRAILAGRRGVLAATGIVRRLGLFMAWSAVSLGAFLLVRGRGPLPLLTGVYLFYLAARGEGENHLAGEMRRLARKTGALGGGSPVLLRASAVRAEAPIWPSLVRAAGRGYAVFCVLDASGRPLGWVTEEEAVAALVRHGLGVEFSLLVKGRGGKELVTNCRIIPGRSIAGGVHDSERTSR